MSDLQTLNLRGKTALISGAAGGIGLALAKEFGLLGMNIVIADIDKNALTISQQALEEHGINVMSCELDVTDYSQWQACVEQSLAKFGKLHMLVNNAGVGGIPGKIEQTDHKVWQWVVDVNLMGVLFGTQAATPSLKAHAEGGWIINVASMAGLGGVPYSSAYAATKAAVVSMTESWAVELHPHNIHVSVLCPAFVKTRIHESLRNKQEKYRSEKADSALDPKDKERFKKSFGQAAALVESGIDPELLAKRVVEALGTKQRYIFTHPNYRDKASYRAKLIDDAFVDAENSELVKHLIGEETVSL